MIGRNSQLKGKSNTSSIVNTVYSLEFYVKFKNKIKLN